MNERIKELWDKAAKEHSGDSWAEQTAFLENFALLIVQECIGTVEGIEPGYKDYRDQIEDAFRRDCVAEIKHKFGVKDELQN